jgi:poly(3-hydroxybutyrate) depolymerase
MNAPASMNEAAAPEQGPGEAQPSEMSPTDRAPEGQPANVGLTPPAMASAMPPAASPVEEPPVPPETNVPAADGAPVPSTGCGSTAAVESGRLTIDVAGATREYILELPEDYDASRPYRLIFAWHWRGGTAADVANGFYGLQQRSEGSAIFVSAEGIDAGWANPGGSDIAFLDAMLARLQSDLCIDESRIFSTGWSYGGMMSLAIGCARGDVFRAIAPMSGALYSGCADSDAPVAFLGFHGDDDDVVPIANGVTARDVFVERNGCQPEAPAVEADGCLRFEGCAAGAPVTWCEFDGGHTPAPGSEQAIWDFFSQF